MTSSLLLLQRSDAGPSWTVRSTASPLQLKPFVGEIKSTDFLRFSFSAKCCGDSRSRRSLFLSGVYHQGEIFHRLSYDKNKRSRPIFLEL